MTAREIIEIVKESNLWDSLTQTEKQEAINHALRSIQLSMKEENIGTSVEEVCLN